MSLEERFDYLERVNRRWRWATLILAAVSASLAAVSCHQQIESVPVVAQTLPAVTVAELIKTRRIELVNEQGAPLVIIGLSEAEGGPSAYGGIGIYDVDGRTLAAMTGGPEGGLVEVANRQGRVLADMGGGKDGGFVEIYNSVGYAVGDMSGDRAGGYLGVYNGSGELVVLLNGSGDAGAAPGANANEQPLVELTGTHTGGNLFIHNRQGLTLAEVAPNSAAGGELTIYNQNETPVAVVAADEAGAGIVEVNDSQGEPKHSLAGNE